MIREAGSIVGDLRGIASTGVRAVRTRLELMAIELKEEKAWVVRFLVVAIASLYLLTFAIVLGIFALALWASEENRPAILGAFAGFFLAGGLAGTLYIYFSAKKRNPPFHETLAVLKGDEKTLHHHLARTAGD